MYCISCNLDMLTSILSSRFITPRRNYIESTAIHEMNFHNKWEFSKIHLKETNDQLVY